jgi:MFS family permease
MTDRRRTAGSILSRPAVARWLASRLCSGIAVTMMRATFLWQLHEQTRSTMWLGLTGIVSFLPLPFASLLGGVVADAFDRKRVLLVTQSVTLLVAIGWLSAAYVPGVPLWFLFALLLLNASAMSFESPSRQAVLPSLVERDELPRAVTVLSTSQAFAFMSGPALAGLVIAASGTVAAFATAAVLAGASIVAVLGLELAPPAGPKRAVTMAALVEGIAFVRGEKQLLAAMSLDLFAVLFGGATALLPVYANEILGVGARGYGLLTSALEIGALATSLVLVFAPPIRRLGRAIALSVAVYGLATIGFGLSRSFPLSVALYVLAGIADQVSVVARSTLVQLTTPEPLRGRVAAVNMIFIGASNQLSAAEAGFVAALTTPTISVAGGGVMVLVVLAIVVLVVPSLLRAEAHSA